MTDTQTLLDKDVQIEELARINALVTDALCDALPYVEDALTDEGFKPGAVQKVVAKIRAALDKAGATALSTPSVGGSLACVPLPPTPEMFAAFQQGFQSQLSVRYKARFKSNPSAAEQMSAEEAGLRAMLAALSGKDRT